MTNRAQRVEPVRRTEPWLSPPRRRRSNLDTPDEWCRDAVWASELRLEEARSRPYDSTVYFHGTALILPIRGRVSVEVPGKDPVVLGPAHQLIAHAAGFRAHVFAEDEGAIAGVIMFCNETTNILEDARRSCGATDPLVQRLALGTAPQLTAAAMGLADHLRNWIFDPRSELDDQLIGRALAVARSNLAHSVIAAEPLEGESEEARARRVAITAGLLDSLSGRDPDHRVTPQVADLLRLARISTGLNSLTSVELCDCLKETLGTTTGRQAAMWRVRTAFGQWAGGGASKGLAARGVGSKWKDLKKSGKRLELFQPARGAQEIVNAVKRLPLQSDSCHPAANLEVGPGGSGFQDHSEEDQGTWRGSGCDSYWSHRSENRQPLPVACPTRAGETGKSSRFPVTRKTGICCRIAGSCGVDQ